MSFAGGGRDLTKEKGMKKKAEKQNIFQEKIPLFSELPENAESCAFSGHRELPEDFDADGLERAIRTLISGGVHTFLFGGAVGFDLLAAECVLALKEKNPALKLVACIPCADQEKYYPAEDRQRYARALAGSDEKILLAEKYYRGCMHRRNDYMAEKADVLLAYCRKNSGGTAYTVRKFRRAGKPVFEL